MTEYEKKRIEIETERLAILKRDSEIQKRTTIACIELFKPLMKSLNEIMSADLGSDFDEDMTLKRLKSYTEEMENNLNNIVKIIQTTT